MHFAYIFDIKNLWEVIKIAIDELRNRHNESKNERNDVIDALGAIRKAFNYTYNYLINNQGDYVPNMQLADLWNEAAVKAMRVDYGLGKMLGEKSSFWMSPQIYAELNNEENIMTLDEIMTEMKNMSAKMQ